MAVHCGTATNIVVELSPDWGNTAMSGLRSLETTLPYYIGYAPMESRVQYPVAPASESVTAVGPSKFSCVQANYASFKV